MPHLYVQRSSGIWKDPAYFSWFLQTLTALFPSSLPSSLLKQAQYYAFLTLFTHVTPQASMHRHILVLESTYRRLFAFIPQTSLADIGALSCDSLPPTTAVSKYDEMFFEGVEDAFVAGGRRQRTRRERVLDERGLAQVILDAAFRRQLQVHFAFL